jgi:predicted nucleic acid-binding protein
MVSLELTLEKERYVDAIIADERIKTGRIEVRDVELPFENVLNYYGLGAGEKEAIVLAHEIEAEIDFLVIDDKLGYIVCDRLGINKAFFLDLILELVEKGMMTDELARNIIEAVKPRYSEGLIQHSLWILERGDRKCLW